MAVFPVLWALWQGMNHVQITQWNPLTLQGAGLFHIAMGAVLGISAFGRTQEKLAGTAVNPDATVSTQNVNMTGNQSGGFGSGSTNNFNSGGGFGSTSGGFGSTPSTGFGSSTPSTGSFGSTPSTGFGSSTPAPTFSTAGTTSPTTGKPLGPAQSFPAI